MFFGLFGKKKTMKREIIINAESLETRVAILENGRVEEFMIGFPPRLLSFRRRDTKYGLGTSDINRIELVQLGWTDGVMI